MAIRGTERKTACKTSMEDFLLRWLSLASWCSRHGLNGHSLHSTSSFHQNVFLFSHLIAKFLLQCLAGFLVNKHSINSDWTISLGFWQPLFLLVYLNRIFKIYTYLPPYASPSKMLPSAHISPTYTCFVISTHYHILPPYMLPKPFSSSCE